MSTGKAFIFSAPSGSGKTTIVRHLLETRNDLEFSISATTRPPRNGEEHGIHYYFLTPETFRTHIQRDELLEWEEVYEDRYYGTLKSELDRVWSKGNHIVFDVDVVGGVNLKRLLGDRARSIFIMADIQVIGDRLRNRGTDSEEEISTRLAKTAQELTYADQFDIIILNDVLDKALADAEEAIQNFIPA